MMDPLSEFRLDGEVAVVTGGSAGLGLAVADAFRAVGAQVAILDLAASGPDGFKVDVSDEAQVTSAFEQVAKRYGRVDVLFNNAGIAVRRPTMELTLEDWNKVVAVNMTGVFLCAREAVRRMSTRHGGAGGAIVNVSSVAARTGSPGEYADYAAAKGAVDSFTVGLAHEVAQEGIRVNAVRPGFIYTDIHASGGEPNRVDRVKAFVPMRRGGTADEVARAIVWLLSDEASFTTGAFVDVAGGR